MSAFTALIAGILTVLSPCILPLLPVVVGGSLRDSKQTNWLRPLVITLSLAVSVFLFTLLIKVSTVFIDIPEIFWRIISGAIILLFGVTLALPELWDKLNLRLGLSNISNQALNTASKRSGVWGDVLIGASLGPVFTSCSPTYALLLATVIPVSLGQGVFYLWLYILGLSVSLFAIALAGNKLVAKLKWAADPNGKFKRTLGWLLILTGFAVATGFDKQIEAWIISSGWYDPISEIELKLNQ